jgi:hypothetical protein
MIRLSTTISVPTFQTSLDGFLPLPFSKNKLMKLVMDYPSLAPLKIELFSPRMIDSIEMHD